MTTTAEGEATQRALETLGAERRAVLAQLVEANRLAGEAERN